MASSPMAVPCFAPKKYIPPYGCVDLPLPSTTPPPPSTPTTGEWVNQDADYSAAIGGAFTAVARFAANAATETSATLELDLLDGPLGVDLTKLTREPIMPGSVRFNIGSTAYRDLGTGILYNTSNLQLGTLDYSTGVASLTSWPAGATAPPTITSCLTRYGNWGAIAANFRTQLAPIKPEALSITVTAEDGEQLTAIADADGFITGDAIAGAVDYEFGTAAMHFGAEGDDPDYTGEAPIPQVWLCRAVDPSTLRYNAVAYSYLPLNADILGIDPVRLPSDGRVPIYRPGDIVMVMHTADTTPATIANGGTLNAGRTRLAWARVIDDNGDTVSGDLYELDRAAGVVTVPDVSELDQPLTLRHTVGDLRMVTDAQISGWLTLSRALTHDYPADESLVAGCLIFGDRRARVSAVWDQASWTNEWADSIIGSEALATLDTIAHPIIVTNEGAETERWLLRWTSTTNVELIGENRGLRFSGPFTEDIAPINPRTRDPVDGTGGVPFLTIPVAANSGGWSTGNCVRINTVGALADFWIARSIQQSDEPADPAAPDGVELYALGNIDRP